MLKLLFGVHNHQPVGNFGYVFQQATEQCYRPFVELLYEYPQIKSTIHFSGSLIDWLLDNDPDLLKKVKEMVKRGQVEILSGGYYEPILPIIPEDDRVGQINMLTKFISEYFGYQPEGMWLGERVWDPELVSCLNKTGMKYILLDEFHLRYAGIDHEHLNGYYLTQNNNQQIAVFPISKTLRYTLPFSPPHQALAYLRSLAGNAEQSAAIIIDDGEKFGLWPGTHKWVYKQKWLEKFFQLLIKNQDWLKTETLSEYMSNNQPLGSKHFPAASYEEMMRWSNGSFSNFFRKYAEANNLHKRMLYISQRMDKQKNPDAKLHLYKAQCNCPYWHGVFGGVYLGHLRRGTYKNLIHAERLMEKDKPAQWIEVDNFDFNADGKDEIIIKNPLLAVFLTPNEGGGIFELDYKPASYNLLDTMTRRPEGYHETIKAKAHGLLGFTKGKINSIHDLLHNREKGLEKFLIYDAYRRISLLDHFFEIGTELESVKKIEYDELGDFINAEYAVSKRQDKQKASVLLVREGQVKSSGLSIPVKIKKQISLDDQEAKIIIDYTLANLSQKPLNVIFAIEFNLSPEGQEAPNQFFCERGDEELIYDLKEDIAVHGLDKIHLQDALGGMESSFCFDQKTDIWSYPLEVVSASAEGFERNWQHAVILPHWSLILKDKWQLKIILQFKPYSVIIRK